MKLENIDHAVNLKRELDQLDKVRYIIEGGGRFKAVGNGSTSEDVSDKLLCVAMLGVVTDRIKQIEEEIKSL